MENYEIAFWKYVAVSVAVFSKIIWKTTKLLFESLLILFLLLFLVKSYGKLRNCFLKVCWLCFCVSVAVFSKIIWKTTKLLFESLVVIFFVFLLLFFVKSYGKLRNCLMKVCWLCFCVSVAVSVAVFVSVAVLKQFLNTRAARLF